MGYQQWRGRGAAGERQGRGRGEAGERQGRGRGGIRRRTMKRYGGIEAFAGIQAVKGCGGTRTNELPHRVV